MSGRKDKEKTFPPLSGSARPPLVDAVDWHEALTRRLRSLLKTGPLHQLRAREGRHGALRPHDDTAALCMKALEVLVDAMGVRPGARREEVAAALRPMLEAGDRLHDVAPSAARHAQVIDLVIGTLLNDAGRRQAYAADYTDFVDGRPVRRTLRFVLASEREALDGAVVLRAEPDGVNLLLRSLDVELEDAQAATEAVMRSQLERGRLDLALHSAREAQIRSVQYHDTVHALIRRTQRDLGRVDWREEVPGLIEEAIEHLSGRMSAEREMRATAAENLRRLLGTPEARTLALICDLLDDCFGRHLELHRALMQAYEVFRREQERQRFAPRPVHPMPDLETGLLQPLLAGSRAASQPAASAFASAASPASAPPLLDLRQLWDRLLRPPPDRSGLGRALDDDGELEAIREPRPVFDEAVASRVDRRLWELDRPTTLDELLARTADPVEARFLALRALQHFAPEARGVLPLLVEKLDRGFELPLFSGDAVVLRRDDATEEARDG